jgi:hypothetical protein
MNSKKDSMFGRATRWSAITIGILLIGLSQTAFAELILKLPGVEINITAVTRSRDSAKAAQHEVKDAGNILKLNDILGKHLSDEDLKDLKAINQKLMKWDAGGSDDAAVTRLKSLASFCDEADAEVRKAIKTFNEVADANDYKNPTAAKLLRDKAAELDLDFVPALRDVRNTANEKVKAATKR